MTYPHEHIQRYIATHKPFDDGADAKVYLYKNYAFHDYYKHVTNAIFENYYRSTLLSTALSGEYRVAGGSKVNIQFNTILEWFKSDQGNIVSVSPRRDGKSAYIHQHSSGYYVQEILEIANRLLKSNEHIHTGAKITAPNMRISRSWLGLLTCHITDIGDGLIHFE